jgi:DNA-binding response OmpR family regulator
MPSLLIVDDDAAIRMLFSRALSGRGDCEEAQNGADALRLLSTRKYDIVLLDLHMPGIDGFAVLQLLGSKPGPNRETPVFIISADTSDQARIQALRRHAVFFMTKPVHLATLTALVDGSLKQAAARKAKTPSRAPSSHDLQPEAPPKGPAGWFPKKG